MTETPITTTTVLHREAASYGLSPAQLRHPVWFHPADGVSIPARAADDLWSQCRAIVLVLAPDAVFTHVTSARLRGWWLPASLRTYPIIACTDDEAPHHDRRGVYVRRCGIPAAHRGRLHGMPVASTEWTIVELAETLSLVDLVVAIDSALHLGDCTVASVRAAMVPRRRGVRVLRRALELVDGRSESPWETILRLVHTLAGIRCVTPQHVVRDAGGAFVARVDLRLGATRRAHEYDGANHREKERHVADLRREKGLLRCRWERYGYTAVEIHRTPGQVVHDAEDALGWAHAPTRVEGWLAEYKLCSLSAKGAWALERRIQRFVRDRSPRSVRPPSAVSGADSSASGADPR